LNWRAAGLNNANLHVWPRAATTDVACFASANS
jgi:hypothetical protein